jgi:hypothetical protein
MKTNHPPVDGQDRREQRGFLMVDLAIGLAVLSIAIIPLGYAFNRERQALKVEYFRAAAGEVVDGEMEILTAGAAKQFPDGTQPYAVNSRAGAILPPGHFELTKTADHLRLTWTPDGKMGVGAVIRETTLK